MIQTFMAWIQAQKESLDAFLAQHPAIKNFSDGLVKAGLVAAASYISATLDQKDVTAITTVGILGAVLSAMKAYSQHSLDSFLLKDATTSPMQKLALKRASTVPTGTDSTSQKGA